MVAAWLCAYAVAVTSPTAPTVTVKPVHSTDNVISRSQVFDHTFLELRTHLRETSWPWTRDNKVAWTQTINTTALPTSREQHALSHHSECLWWLRFNVAKGIRLLIYGEIDFLLTYSMQQSPSWEANWFCR